MAATSMISPQKGSDTITDFCCSTCEEDFVCTEADFYCETCRKLYCCKCINLHSQLFKRHIAYGRNEKDNWPAAKGTVDLIEKCEEHPDKTLEVFCEDHLQLCCNNCVMLTHRQCTQLTLISEYVKTHTSPDFQQLSTKMQIIQMEIRVLQQRHKCNINFLQDSYTDQLEKLRNMRKKINAQLDELEKATVKGLEELKTNLNAPLNEDVDKCSRFDAELVSLSEAVHVAENKNKELAFMAYIKCTSKIQQYEAYLHENPAQNKCSISLQPDTDIELFLSKLSGLCNIVHDNRVITVSTNKVLLYPKGEYIIRGICKFPNGQIIIADAKDSNVKLMDQTYQVISRCNIPAFPLDMCLVSPNEVAVTVEDWSNIHEVQFISESKGQLVKGRTNRLGHTCIGISYLNGNLYVTSKTALYQYTVAGMLVKKIYEDKSEKSSMGMCAVNPRGEYIYVTDKSQHKLLTLTKDGQVLSTFSDLELQEPYGICVTPSGQVLVCYQLSNAVIQVDSEGRTKIAVLATEKDGVLRPLSSYYCKNTNTIIVGQRDCFYILLIKVK